MQDQVLIILGFILAFVIAWLFFSWAFSRISGWTTLAQTYPAPQVIDGQQWYAQSAVMKHNFTFRGSLIIRANQQGICFSDLFPFHIAQPPFFVPWIDIYGKETKKGLYRLVELRFEKALSIPVTINIRLANKFELVSNKWHYVRLEASNQQNQKRQS